MSWNAGKIENSNNLTTNQNKYSGMVRVLPSFPAPVSPVQSLHQRSHASTSSAFTSAVPRLPPPPKSSRLSRSKTIGPGKPETGDRLSSTTSFQDLRQVGSSFTQEWKYPVSLSSDNFYDRRKLHLSAHDLRDIENMHVNVKPQLSFTRPVSYSAIQESGVSIATPLEPAQPPKFTAPKSTVSSGISAPKTNYEFSTAKTPIIAKQSSNHEMRSLHDELAQLRLELAAMKDPMREHEEWLRCQSVQVKELEDLQRKFQLSMVTDKNNNPQSNTKTFNNMPTTFLAVPPSVNTKVSNTPPQPTSPKPTFMKPTKELRPPTSPKPNQQTLNTFKFSKTPVDSPPKPAEMTKGETVNKNYGRDETAFAKYSSNEQTVNSTKPSTSSDIKVKRISQLFEANSNANERSESQKKINSVTHTKNGTVKKLSPGLLQSLQSLQTTQSFPKSLTPRCIDFQSTSGSTQKSTASPSSLPPHQSPNSPKLSSRPNAIPVFSNPAPASKSVGTTLQPVVQLSGTENELSSKKFTLPHTLPSFKPQTDPNVPPLSSKSSSVSRVSSTVTNSSLLLHKPSPSSPKSSVPPSLSPNPTILSKEPFSSPQQTIENPPSEPPSSFSKPPDLPSVPPPAESTSLSHSSVPPPPPLFKPTILPCTPSSSGPLVLPNTQVQFTKPLLPSSTGSGSLESSHLPLSPTQSKNHNESITDELDTTSPSKIVKANDLSPSLPKSIAFIHRYENVPVELEFETVPDEMQEEIPALPPKDFMLDKTKSMSKVGGGGGVERNNHSYSLKVSPSDRSSNRYENQVASTSVPAHPSISKNLASIINATLPGEKSNAFSTHSFTSIARPTAPPPPPPMEHVQDVPISSPPPAPPLPPTSTPISSHTDHYSNELPLTPQTSESAFEIQQPPQSSDFLATQALSFDSPQNASKQSSGKSSLSSLPGTPLSSMEPASKADLMEQIRQFKQSGKALKRSISEIGDSNNGSLTRVRKNSMHDALQTRFHAFCGNQSESDSSDNEENTNQDEYDWDD